MIVKIYTGPLNYTLSNLYNKQDNEYNIGVDQGCKFLLENDIHINLALGDFDSLDNELYNLIKENAEKLHKLNVIKNHTDTYIAVKEALLLEPEEIIIYGGLGKRIDHTIANINLLKLGNITMVNDETIMYLIEPGKHIIKNKHKYISFFSIEDIKNLSLDGFKYPLNNIELDIDDPLCISNEGEGVVTFTEGLLLVIHQSE